MRKNKLKVIWITVCIAVIIVLIFLYITLLSNGIFGGWDKPGQEADLNAENSEMGQTSMDVGEENKIIEVNLDISDYYITNTGNPNNLYYIDENNVLWGSGSNDCGQLGQGTQDYDFYEEMVKIAENVIHVDYSQEGFVIYLTKDYELYGFGNEVALQQYDYSQHETRRRKHYTINSPVLLLEDAIYARCGRGDVAAIKTDSSIWIWGAVWSQEAGYSYYQCPTKILENAALVTGGLFNHAALLRDGSVWTWGYNYSGNCGVEDLAVFSQPQKVADEVMMVWTGSIKYNIDCQDINELEDFERSLENTIILKNDGSYWICGANAGDEEKVLPVYYETVDYTMICTSEFLPYDGFE